MNLKTLFWTVSMQIFLLLASTLKGKLKLSVWNPRLRNALYQIFQSNLKMSLFEIWMNRSTCMMDIEVKNFLDPVMVFLALGFYCLVCVCKKSFLCSWTVERKGNCISVIVFGKNIKMLIKSQLKNCYWECHSLIFFFYFQSCEKSRLYKLGCKCMTVLLTDKG